MSGPAALLCLISSLSPGLSTLMKPLLLHHPRCPQVTPPFNMLPRATLEGGCNTVLGTFSPMIMRLFLSKLADDYSRWSTDAAYRCVCGCLTACTIDPSCSSLPQPSEIRHSVWCCTEKPGRPPATSPWSCRAPRPPGRAERTRCQGFCHAPMAAALAPGWSWKPYSREHAAKCVVCWEGVFWAFYAANGGGKGSS